MTFCKNITFKIIPFLLLVAMSGLLQLNTTGQTELPENDSLKSILTKPFEVDLTYEIEDCGGQLVKIAEINGQPPFFWYELDTFGYRINTWVNPKLQQLKDETLYLVEDAWQRQDTIYLSFNKSVIFVGLHPNPFREDFALRYKSDFPIMVNAEIFDLTGKPIEKRTFLLDTEKQELIFNPQNWSHGTYILKLSSICFSETMKLVYMGE